MSSLHSFSDHVSGLAAKTVKASTHGLQLNSARLRERDITTKPAKFLISDPALLSTRRSNPYFGISPTMRDCQRPLCVELNYFVVRNNYAAQRIYNLKVGNSQDHFGFYPDQVHSNCQNQTDRKFKDTVFGAGCNQHTVHSKEKYQYKGDARPEKVAAGAKGFIHITIIAGETK